MCTKRNIFIFILSLTGIISIYAQEKRTEICIDFRVNSRTIDSTYMDNKTRLTEILSSIQQLHQDTTMRVLQVTFCGVASPEGSYQINRRLASQRLEALEQYIRTQIQLPEDIIIRHNETYIPWNYLIAEIGTSDMECKEEILSILRSPSKLVPYYGNSTVDSRIPALKKLKGGRIWTILNKRYFPKMRNACAVLITMKEEPIKDIIPTPTPISTDTIVVVPIEPAPQPVPALPQPEGWTRHLYLKSNSLGLGMGIANIAAEIDLAKHWSFTLPVYYSAWDYFKSTIKFRTFAVQPELRYWPSENNNGFFAGAHFGLAYYNFAFDDDYRYQDHNRETPAIGGGFSIGYRLPISKNHRWQVEFSIGGGIYPLHYDKFHNTPNTKDGLMTESIKKTYWGIDQAAVSLAYTFGLKKKGGKR